MARGDEEEEMLLNYLRECRRSMIKTINAAGDAPDDEALRKLANVQGSISALEAVINEIGTENVYLKRGLLGSAPED